MTRPTTTTDKTSKPRLAFGLAIVFTLALAARLALLFAGPWHHPQNALDGDSLRYLQLGRNIATLGVFGIASPEVGPMHRPIEELRNQRNELPPRDPLGLRPDTLRTPGYPAFLALCDSLHLSARVTLLLQCLLGAGLVFPVFLLARSLLDSSRAGFIAALVVALHPADVLSANLFLSETLFTLALLWSLAIAARKTDVSHAAGTLNSSLLLSIATLTRPVTFLLGPALGLWIILRDRNRAALAHAFVFVLVSILPIAAWSARNASLGVGFRPTTLDSFTVFSKNAAYVRMAGLNQHEYPRGWGLALDQLHGELREQIQPGETVLAAMRRIGGNEIKQHPLTFTRILADSAIKFMTDHSTLSLYAVLGREYRPTGLRTWLMGRLTGNGSVTTTTTNPIDMLIPAAWMLLNLTLALLAVVGAARLVMQRRWSAGVLLVGVMAYFILTTQSLGLERMRVPVIGVQATLVAAALLPRRRAASQSQAPATITPDAISPLRRAA